MVLGEVNLRYYGSMTLGVIGLVGFVISCFPMVVMIQSRKIKQLKYRLVFNLFLSNALQGFGYGISLAWKDNPAVVGDPVCLIQSWIFNFADVGAALWNLIIAVYLLIITRATSPSCLPGVKFEIFVQVSVWGTCIFLASFGMIFYNPYEFYVPIAGGSWCWIGSQHDLAKLLLLYLWFYITCFLLILIYGLIVASYCNQKNFNKETKTLLSLLVGFPLVFCLCYLPLSLFRLVGVVMGKDPPLVWVYVTASFFPFEGILNTFLYGKTRKIFPCYGTDTRTSSNHI